MEKFYLENADFYRALLKSLNKTSPGPRTPQQLATETTSPDVVVCARIRPLLEEDVAAGFPCAVFPRVARPGTIDIHDLYNHPRGRPILKVRCQTFCLCLYEEIGLNTDLRPCFVCTSPPCIR